MFDTYKTVVFDLDGTLLNGDSTGTWLRLQLLRSPARLMVGLLVSPLALVLIKYPRSRRYGASMLLWIATVGVDEAGLSSQMEMFASKVNARNLGLYWYAEGINALEKHLAAGDRVLVVTAAPQYLAECLLKRWRPALQVIGSSLRRINGGWVAKRHCRGQEKCTILAEQGFGTHWAYAYSDSDDDAPILAAAERAILINATELTVNRAQVAGVKQPTLLNWN